MKPQHLIIYTEEESAKKFLNEILKRIWEEYTLNGRYTVISANGKYDQEHQLARKLKGFANNQGCLIVLRDQDNDACKVVKQRYVSQIQTIWKQEFKVRFLCKELETCYFSDPKATKEVLGIKVQLKKPCDEIDSPARELQKLLGSTTHFSKTTNAIKLGRCIDYKNPTSPSFKLLMSTIFEFLQLHQ